MSKITDEEIKDYLSNGGNLLTVTHIDSYRDGGTKVITCNYATPIKYYVDKDKWTLHSDYPTTDENLVKDDFLKKYLIEGMKTYTQRLYVEVLRIEDWICNIEQ